MILLAGIGRILASNPPVFSNVELSPPLDISRFSSYQATADIAELPTGEAATVSLTGINGDGGNYWNYYADGTPVSDTVTKTMSYDSNLAKWKSTNIYPDSIYPEIFFAPSSITWNNPPNNIVVRRNNYHLMHFDNQFTTTANMNFWVEVNAYRRSAVNSANLEIYLVEKGHDITYFQSDWRAKAGVELIGTVSKDVDFNHVHTSNAAHHLIPLSANADGTFGTKKLNISNDFWVIVYSQSPNDARSFDLRYQPPALCNNSNDWYVGSQAGWTTTAQAGCPDAHVHLARRSNTGGIRDGVKLITAATYGGETGAKTTNLYYNELPNLAPNATSFNNPTVGGTYSGNIGVSWNQASDPNHDPLKYSLYLLDNKGQQVGSALLTDSSSTSYTLQTAIPGQEIPNGSYSLKGVVCDQGVPNNDPPDAPLCTNFVLPGTFNIDNSNPIRSISSISLSSNNARTGYAKAGDTVTLNFVSSSSLSSPTVNLYSDGTTPINDVTLTSSNNINWSASYLVSAQANSGEVSFEISSTSLDKNYYDTTDSTKVIVDVVSPTVAALSPANLSDKNAVSSNLVLTLDEATQAVAAKNLTIKKTLDDSVFETVNLTGANVTLNGETITVDPTNDLSDKTQYYVLIDPGSFVDNPGNSFAGVSNKNTWTFTVGDMTPPRLSAVSISSNNPNPSFATVGDIVTILIEADETILAPSFDIKLNGKAITNTPVITNTSGNLWTAVFEVAEADEEGLVSFAIDYSDISNNAGTRVISSTNESTVSVTKDTVPSVTVTSTESTLSSSTPVSSAAAPTSTPLVVGAAAESTRTVSVDSTKITTPLANPTISTSKDSAAQTVATPGPTATYGPAEDLYDLRINVFDGEKPLAGVAVELYSFLRKGFTDVNGQVDFPNVESGVHKIKIFYGKDTVEKEVIVSGLEKQIRLNINVRDKGPESWVYCLAVGLTLAVVLIILFLARKKRKPKVS